MSWLSGGWKFVCALAVLALAASALAACDDESSATDGLAAAAQAPPPLPPRPPQRDADMRWPRDDWGKADLSADRRGVLVKPSGGEVRGWGDFAVRRHVTALFAHMQYDFMTGNTQAVCRNLDGRALPLSTLPAKADTPCRVELDANRRQLQRNGFKPTPLRFLWVREYPGVAGIWVESRTGERFRVPFVRDGEGPWKLQLSDLRPPEAIAMPIVTTR